MDIDKFIDKLPQNTIVAYLTKGIIYKISCNLTGKCYYGSTIQTLAKRASVHKMETNFSTSKEIIKNGDWKIESVEEVIFKNKIELLLRERFYIEADNNSINKNRPCVSSDERAKQSKEIMRKWYLAHRTEHIKKMSIYQDQNAEAHREAMRRYQHKIYRQI